MPTNYSGRITTIAIVLLLSLWAIFPSGNPMRPDLKPGIDMVGGTSLLYEIKVPEDAGGTVTTDLAERVMASLKKRVDPDGVRNLIWRPQGNTRLEIQMPLTAGSGEADKVRADYLQAQQALESANVRPAEVLVAVEETTGDARREKLNALAHGSDARGKLFGAFASLWDQIADAKQKQDAERQAQAENAYEALKPQLDKLNLSAAELETALDLKGDARQKKLDEIKARFADVPTAVKSIDGFVAAYDGFKKSGSTIDSAAELKRLLRGSGVLEFHILANASEYGGYQDAVQKLLAGGPKARAGNDVKWFEVEKPSEFENLTQAYNDKHYVLAYVTPDKAMINREGQTKWALARAYPINENAQREVGFEFDAQGSKLFGELTGNNVGRPLGIVLDGRMISAPNINTQILGRGSISGSRDTGGFSEGEQGYLIRTLDAGSLPAQLTEEPISERTVGPQLGRDNLMRGLYACIFGLIVVAVFLTGYYYIAGVVATLAVFINMVLILGSMAALNATFTLAGVAGIVLTIGMAVDANVLIFERLREEQQRGLTLRMALRNAYDRAWSAILDGNVTTGITAGALYLFGSEEVKGFGLTLLLGMIASLFTALYVTKTMFGLLIDKGFITRLNSFPLSHLKWDKALRPDIDWMGKAWMFYAFSGAFIAIGLVLFGIKWSQGRVLDIEFASGTAVQFELKDANKMPIGEVRELIDAESRKNPDALPAPSVVSVGDDDKTYEIVTPNNNSAEVRKSVLNALGQFINVQVESKFDGVEKPIDQVMEQSVFPITAETRKVGPFSGEKIRAHAGGVAILLNNLSPPLKADEVKRRIDQQRLLPQVGGALAQYDDLDVETTADGGTALVLATNSAFSHSLDAGRWTTELAGPMWRLVRDSINKPADLQKVTNFDAQVAGETQRDAMVAMFLSIVAIMAYIWMRFGNLKYGTATVVALLHDTLFTLAAVGFAHYVADTFVGAALLIEPFRMNLTLVAAILTIMGYSMNDTVVVFDRVRENRGKFGHVDRRVINDSINQTLSRTLLTGGTTIVTIFVMYIFGGAGIHGFTFALLVGIVVGTYSSIAIASPILLLGSQEPAGADAKRMTPVGQLQRAG